MTTKQKKAVKFAGLLLIILVTATLTEAVIKFARTYEYKGFVKKGSETVTDIQNERAIALTELEQCKAQKQQAIEASNPDLFQPLTIK